jgi:hypothetical protein
MWKTKELAALRDENATLGATDVDPQFPPKHVFV